MEFKKCPLRLLRKLYNSFNHRYALSRQPILHLKLYICHRNIDEVGDFELYYTLFCGQENLLHFIGIICHEISRFPNAPLLNLHRHESSAIREANLVQFTSEIGWSDICQNVYLLNYYADVLSQVSAIRMLLSQKISQWLKTLYDTDIEQMLPKVLKAIPYNHPTDGTGFCMVLDWMKAQDISKYHRLFDDKEVDQDVIYAIRSLAESLCEEYNERWNLYLVRFDCLLKVFLKSKSLNDSKGLQTLLAVINRWRNGNYARFRMFNIYDIYRATMDILKIDKATCNARANAVIDLYSSMSQLGLEESYQSFIKKINIPEPPNRGGLPEGFSTKKFYAKISKHYK
ncbi:hypothetical protein X943_004085 [Babesia divergens]|uniref:Microprotein domain-containing protein n=1 Tax=Babesia divergens TaxID=32595 RepID=A0AAD9GDQ1_BABDI|nr:hypothetical protein X943_004085 [Babesia divergens]